jgi:hypothetical protein
LRSEHANVYTHPTLRPTKVRQRIAHVSRKVLKMSSRDDFSKKTKNFLAMRAGWHCSLRGCGKSTVGPSEESSTAVTVIGDAAHIYAAAPGLGSRRRNDSMTPEARAGIDNAIWLCADHARLIDRDEVTYSAEELREMKREHEANRAKSVRLGKGHDLGAGLLAIGPNIICTGDIRNVSASSWTLHIKHFVEGDVHELVSYIDRFEKAAADEKYILANEAGDGRVLVEAPSLTKESEGYTLLCPVATGAARVDVQNLGSDMALHPETGDIYLDGKGNIARVSGIDYLPQKVQAVLSMQRQENVFAPSAGVRFFEYFEAFQDSPWLALLMKLDFIRQAAIPRSDSLLNRQDTPLRCVTRVYGFDLLSDTPVENRLPVRVELEIQGLGRWQRDLSIYLPTKEQMDERARMIAERPMFSPT